MNPYTALTVRTAIIGPPTLVNAIADALSPFGEFPVELPLTPAKLLVVMEGRPLPAKERSRFAMGEGMRGSPSG